MAVVSVSVVAMEKCVVCDCFLEEVVTNDFVKGVGGGVELLLILIGILVELLLVVLSKLDTAQLVETGE